MSNDPVANLTREFVKSYAKNNGLENDTMVNAVANLTSSLINSETTHNTDNTSTNTTEEPKQHGSSPENPMGNLLGGLFGNLSQHREMPLPPRNDTSTNTLTSVNTTPYQLINNYYGTLWGKANMYCLKPYFTTDALLSYATTSDTEQQWRITSRDKIVEYFQQLWLPKIRNKSTMIYKFNFSIDDESTEYINCTVDYIVTQTQLDTDTMKWNKYHIDSTDKLVLVHDNGNYRFFSLNIILRKKELIEEESQY
jgi:hypothetical protein